MKGSINRDKRGVSEIKSSKRKLSPTQYEILESMKITSSEGAQRLYKRLALPSKGFPLPRPVPTPVYCNAVHCSRTFTLDPASNGASITVRPSLDNFMTASGFSNTGSSATEFVGNKNVYASAILTSPLPLELPDLISADGSVIPAVPAEGGGLPQLSTIIENSWMHSFDCTGGTGSNEINFDVNLHFDCFFSLYGLTGSTWSLLKTGQTTGAANTVSVYLNQTDIPALSPSYGGIALFFYGAQQYSNTVEVLISSDMITTAGSDASNYRPLDVDVDLFDAAINSAQFMSITAFSCLVSFMGSTLNNGGQVAMALLPAETVLPDSIEDQFAKLTSLNSHSYDGRLEFGAYGHYIPGRVQDLFFTKERSINGSFLQTVIKNIPATDTPVIVRVQTVLCYELITNSPVLSKEIGSSSHNLVDVLVAFAHMICAVGENPSHVKAIMSKAKAFAKRPEVIEAVEQALKLAAKGAVSLAPLLFP